ncbi:MAG: hypothetical protein WBQ17_11715 [Rhizomicrobium sp.]|jgi:hypothetical protein
MRILAAAFAGTMLFAGAAQAQDCALDELASLPITTLPGGAIAVPVKVNGTAELFAVSLQSPHTAVSTVFAHELGQAAGNSATISDFQIGAYHFGDVSVAQTAETPADTAGVLGVDTLREYDVEFDFKNSQMILFVTSQCPGPGVVHWAKQYTVVPMHIDASGHLVAQLTLDAKPVNAVLSTAPEAVVMRAPEPVKALSIGALSLNNPQVAAGDVAPGAEVRVGLDELKNLHLFLAFSANKLYATP